MLMPEAQRIVQEEIIGRWPDGGWETNPKSVTDWVRMIKPLDEGAVIEALQKLWQESRGKTPIAGRFKEFLKARSHGRAHKTPVGYTNWWVIRIEDDNPFRVGTKHHITFATENDIPEPDIVRRIAASTAGRCAELYGGDWQAFETEKHDILDKRGNKVAEHWWFVGEDTMTVDSYCFQIRQEAIKNNPEAVKKLEFRPKVDSELSIADLGKLMDERPMPQNPYLGMPAGWLAAAPERPETAQDAKVASTPVSSQKDTLALRLAATADSGKDYEGGPQDIDFDKWDAEARAEEEANERIGESFQ